MCCNIHGQCGLTSDFCVEAPADTGAPGAAKPGSNGCISNCGSRIVNNAEAPAQFISIGYFEAWNMDRRCQHMDISSMNNLRVTPPTGSGYTHVHFAFPNITWNLEVDVSNFTKQFDGLKKLNTFITNKKRIISFGGWAFSNDAPTYQILRFAVSTEANRQKLARNVVNFVNEHGLDGVDFDWEYPGVSVLSTPRCSPQQALTVPSGFRHSWHTRRQPYRRRGLPQASQGGPQSTAFKQVTIDCSAGFVLVSPKFPSKFSLLVFPTRFGQGLSSSITIS